MKKLKFVLGVAFLTLLVSVNLIAQKTEPQTKEVPKELKDRLELYWKNFLNEDWENLFEMTALSKNKKEYQIVQWKQWKRSPAFLSRKEDSTLEISEIRLEEKMKPSSFEYRTEFSSSVSGYELGGCTKIVDKDGNENWFKNESVVLQNPENEWLILHVGVLYVSVKDGSFTPCDKDISLLPIKIEGK